MVDDSPDFISTKRIETLVDGIFAIAMTLLVLGIELPTNSGMWNSDMVWTFLGNQVNNLFFYAISFYILATFWINHHRVFDRLNRADQGFWWLTVLWLLFIVLVPFSTNLVGDFGSTVPASLFFNVNLLITSLVLFLTRRYVIVNGLSDRVMSPDLIKKIYRINLVFPSCAIIGIMLSFIYPQWSSIVYLFAPMAIHIIQKH